MPYKMKPRMATKTVSLFNFCNIFDILTSRTEKIAWQPLVFKPDFYMFSYNEQLGKFKEVSSTSFCCIKLP